MARAPEQVQAAAKRPQVAVPPGARYRIEELFREHSARVARLAFRLLGREDEVDDIVQDVFMMLYRHLDRIRETEAIGGWLSTTTVRMVGRRMRLRRVGLLLGLRDRAPELEVEGHAASGEDRTALRNVHLALERVSSSARIAWTLRYLEEERIEDVARLCGCSVSTVKRRIADAHDVVKKALGHE